MDSASLLDYVLFQLTPTRTRCDLVIFSGKKNEKVASGLLQPFISHLKSAQDQISRGGYSITLRPSTPHTSNSSWFTKATLERFVKFVSSPEVLERFVSIEREIVQIESSVQPNEQPISVASEAEVESNGTGETSQGEDSKARLQRILETRKAVLRKEQAMAYARALVSGFEAGCLEDLISFANAFGALRLREACVSFLELCTKKSDDGMWMHEVAAMQACSPSELAGEEKLCNQDTMMNQNELASTHFPQYLQRFPGPGFPQTRPFPGYLLPGMQAPLSYFPGNVPWPPNVDDCTRNVHHQKGSSKTIVIRNINYVTSRRNDEEKDSSSSDSSSYASDSIKRQIEQAVGALERPENRTSHSKKKRDGTKIRHSSKNREEGVENADMGTSQEDFFATKSLGDDDRSSPFNAQTEGLSKHHAPSNDSFIVTERDIHVEDQLHLQNFGAGETTTSLVSRGGDTGDEELVFANRTREMDSYPRATLSIGAANTTIIRRQKEEDWFKCNQPDLLSSNGGFKVDNSIFVGEENKKDVLADDSFIVQTNSVGKTSSDYQPTADIFMVSDIIGANQPKHNILEVEATNVNEPDDLCMVLERDNAAIDQVDAPWSPEMDYGNDKVNSKLPQNDNKVPNTRDRTTPGEKGVRKETSSRTPTKSEITSRIKKSSSTPKTKSFKEEESRKKMEELALQRQRRIAERTVSNRPTTNKTMKDSKRSMATLGKVEKPKYQASTGEAEKLHKPICRSSTIDRLATARITHTPYKESQNRSSRKTNHQKVKPSDKSSMNKSNTTSSEGRPRANEVDDFRDIKELQTISSVEKIENHMVSSTDTFVNEERDQMSNGRFSMPPNEDQSVQPDSNSAVSDEVKVETHHSRKKWITGGDSPQVTNDIRKLLLFGRKS